MITTQQRKALVFIEAEMERTGGVAPTVREIAAHFHYRSTSPARRRCMRAGQRTDVSPARWRAPCSSVLNSVGSFAACLGFLDHKARILRGFDRRPAARLLRFREIPLRPVGGKARLGHD